MCYHVLTFSVCYRYLFEDIRVAFGVRALFPNAVIAMIPHFLLVLQGQSYYTTFVMIRKGRDMVKSELAEAKHEAFLSNLHF